MYPIDPENLYVVSDLHIGHAKLSTEWRHFPTPEDHTDWIVDTWNDTVSSEDSTFILGDAIMGQFHENVHHLGRLNGSKYLIPGNHDRVHPCYWPPKKRHRIQEFAEIYSQYVSLIGLSMYSHGFLLCHFPYRGLVDEDRESGNRYEEYWPEDDGVSILLHGHLHSDNGGKPHHPRMLDVGIDNMGRPVSLDEVKELFA